MGGETSTLGGGKKHQQLTLHEVRKQAKRTAKDTIRQLQESIDHDFMSYPELIRILRFYLKKSIDEAEFIFRPENMPASSLRKVGLKKLYRVLEKMEKKDQKEARRNGVRHDCP